VRRQPRQRRSQARTEQVLQAAAVLLDEVGFDDLTTTRIAERAGISVGTLYHYFPNKHAILHALGERWLHEVAAALDELATQPLEQLDPGEFARRLVDCQLEVYRRQRGILPLVRAMFSVPELRPLDERHDAMTIDRLTVLWRRRGFRGGRAEAGRIARATLELHHALLLVIVHQRGQRAARTRDDLYRLTRSLLQPYLD
jgi:AcrR family transcriptional regulator